MLMLLKTISFCRILAEFGCRVEECDDGNFGKNEDQPDPEIESHERKSAQSVLGWGILNAHQRSASSSYLGWELGRYTTTTSLQASESESDKRNPSTSSIYKADTHAVNLATNEAQTIELQLYLSPSQFLVTGLLYDDFFRSIRQSDATNCGTKESSCISH